jgi:hypothetical protein
MVGMPQIITYLLCLYLIYKGFEILQIALMSPREHRGAGLVIGGMAVIVSIVAAFVFTQWVDSQARRVGGSQSGLTPSLGGTVRLEDLPRLKRSPPAESPTTYVLEPNLQVSAEGISMESDYGE